MATTLNGLKYTAVSALLACMAIGPATSFAAPGTLADTPLFLTNPVEPNILFLVDDSGSMDWGLMTKQDSGIVSGDCGFNYYYTHPTVDNDDVWVVPTEKGLQDVGVAAPYGGVWRAWNRDYNRIYYDPSLTYTPWPGENAAGVLYVDANPLAAPINPQQPSAGVVDLTATSGYITHHCSGGLAVLILVTDFHPARYYLWGDTDADGVVDAEDEHKLIEIDPATTAYPSSATRSDCASAVSCSYAEEIQNFANWFSYYRKRELVAKAGYGRVIAGASNSRMGLVTLNNNGTVNTAIDSMNQDPLTGAKKSLLDSLYAFQGGGDTPLRTTFNEAGEYLSCDPNTLFGTCPALPAASGGECQQNFNVMMTDGYYNGSFGASLGNTDGDNNTAWDSTTAGPYGDSEVKTLGDIAMEFYENDIRPGVANNLTPPPGGIDENTMQHVVTYSVAFGVEGTLTSMPANTTDPFTWPAPASDAAKIDDLRHAAWNGRGEFLSAQRPAQLIGGLRTAMSSIQGRTGSSASVAFNTGSLSTNSEVYLALFNSQRWNGDLLAFDLNPGTGAVSATPNWSAGTRLTTRDISTSQRTILSYDGTDGIAFDWSALTTAQKNDFRTNSSGILDNEATGMARHGYLRGDRACEFSSSGSCYYNDGTNTYAVKSLRERASRLGDIVHSGPVYVGTPESNWPNVAPFPGTAGDTYNEYRTAQATRPGVVYVGSNDGMLHAIAQSDGDELFAYVPNALYSSGVSDGLHYLSEPAYTHRYSVDLTASVADVYAQTKPSGTVSWKSVLVGGLRGGGRGMFALDVTNPAGFSESGTAPADAVMWEFTSTDDADLGHTFSRPSIVPLEGPGNTIRWGVVVGNGYNDLGSGEAKLFILLLEGGLDGTWTAGTDYVEITTGVGDTVNRNGLSTPAIVDTDGDGMADRAYAGDLEGNMWAFDLSGSNPGTWDVAYKSGTTPKPLFIAPANQQITASPVIVRNKSIPTAAGNLPNTLVIFGTGQYLVPADVTTVDTQSMYGIWDAGDQELTQSDLVEQTIGLGTTTESVVGRTLSSNTVDYAFTNGWYINLPDAGERQVTDPAIRGDLVFFNTTTPNSNPCDAGGSSWLMVASWLTGGAPLEVAFDLNGDGLVGDLDEISGAPAAGMELSGIATSPVNLANKRYTSTTETTGGSTIEVTEILDLGGPNTGRLSWEELNP